MTPLQKIAMGLVITIVDAPIAGYDAVPDVVGWVLVVLGLTALRPRLPLGTLVTLAAVSALVSLASIRPDLLDRLPESAGWALSLPQIAFSYVLSGAVAGLVGGRPARRFRALRWAFVVAAAGPVLLYGGGVDVLLVPLAVVTVAANVYLVYLLFRASTEVHGPRLDLRPRPHGGPPTSPDAPAA